MLSHKSPLRLILLLSAVMFLMTSLAACNFRPLHGKNPHGTTTHEDLSRIYVPEVETRISQLVRNNLLSDLSAQTAPGAASYELQFDVNESKTDALVQNSSEVTLVNYTLRVKYRLFDLRTKRIINNGESFSVISYDRGASEFGNVRAEQNVQKRAAKAVSTDLRTRIGAFFATN